jgi:hypothetical protein
LPPLSIHCVDGVLFVVGRIEQRITDPLLLEHRLEVGESKAAQIDIIAIGGEIGPCFGAAPLKPAQLFDFYGSFCQNARNDCQHGRIGSGQKPSGRSPIVEIPRAPPGWRQAL